MYHSVWLGFELFEFRCVVNWRSLRSRAKDMTTTIVILNPINGASVWMYSCPEEMGWEFGRFWKRFSWVPTMLSRSWELTMDHADRQLSFCHLGREWISLPESWVSTVAAAVKFFGSRLAKMNWDLKHNEMCRALGWCLHNMIWNNFRHCVSLFVSKNRTQNLINRSYLNNRAACFCTWICILYLHLYMYCCYRYNYDYVYEWYATKCLGEIYKRYFYDMTGC